MAELRIRQIDSLEAPELEAYRTLPRTEEHERAGIFVATNVKVVQRLLASDFEVVSALLTPAWFAEFEKELRSRPEETIVVFVGEKSLLETVTGYHLHQGAMAIGKIPAQPTFDELLERAPRPVLLAAVEGIASADNLGAIIRGCAAFGVHFLIVGETCVSPYQRRVISGSMGSIFEQPLVRTSNLIAALATLRAKDVRCIAAHLGPGASSLSQIDLLGNTCIVLGAEGPGLTKEVVSICDHIAQIKMPAHMNSLNVASASAVFLYEAARQRGNT